jgi:hypothetical protein
MIIKLGEEKANRLSGRMDGGWRDETREVAYQTPIFKLIKLAFVRLSSYISAAFVSIVIHDTMKRCSRGSFAPFSPLDLGRRDFRMLNAAAFVGFQMRCD